MRGRPEPAAQRPRPVSLAGTPPWPGRGTVPHLLPSLLSTEGAGAQKGQRWPEGPQSCTETLFLLCLRGLPQGSRHPWTPGLGPRHRAGRGRTVRAMASFVANEEGAPLDLGGCPWHHRSEGSWTLCPEPLGLFLGHLPGQSRCPVGRQGWSREWGNPSFGNSSPSLLPGLPSPSLLATATGGDWPGCWLRE